MSKLTKVLFFANTDWYLYNFRLPLAEYLNQNGFEVIMVSPSGEFGEKIMQAGIRWIPIAMDRRSFNLFTELKLIRAIIRTYKEERPDIVHHFTIKCVVYGAIAAWLSGCRTRINAITGLGHVFVNHNPASRLLRPILSVLLRVTLRGDRSLVIMQNPDDAALFIQMRLVPSSRMRVIRGSGVDTVKFDFIDRTDRQTPTRILMACRLLRDKGIREYIEAVKLVNSHDFDVQFLLAGMPDSGNPSAVPLDLIRRWHQNAHITYFGHVEDMVRLLHDVDVMVLPSYREGLPRGLIEAGATGLPLISTDVPGCREVVENGVNGLLVPPKDVKLLAEAIIKLVRNPKMRTQMGKLGRKKILKEFDESIVFKQTLDVYRELQNAT